MNIGVTGTSGFLGGSFIRFLAEKEEHTTSPYLSRLESKDTLKQFVSENDVIVNFAGKNRDTEENIIQTNLIDAIWLAYECVKQNKKIIQIGSTNSKNGAFKFSKSSFNNSLCDFDLNFCLRFGIVRCPNVIGKHCRPFYNSFITTLLYSIANNKTYKNLINNENSMINYCLVDDLNEQVYDFIFSDNQNLYIPYHTLTIKKIIDILTEKSNPSCRYEAEMLKLKDWYRGYEL